MTEKNTTPHSKPRAARTERPVGEEGAGVSGNRAAGRADPPPRTPASQPLWRILFDAADATLTPSIEAFLRREEVATVLTSTARVESRARHELDRWLIRYWHFWNLPAYTDVRRSAERVATVERRLGDLADEDRRNE